MWQSFRSGKFAFTILAHALCPQCEANNTAISQHHFTTLAGILKGHTTGKDELLVSDDYAIIFCPPTQGGCGHFSVLQNGVTIGSRYEEKPYVDAVRVEELELLCAHCTKQNSETQETAKRKKKKHRKRKKDKSTKH